MKRNQKPARSTATASALSATPAPPAISATLVLSWLTQAALVIALVTIVGAWYVLHFEAGYFGYFHIPYYFVSLSPSIALGTSWLWVALLLYLCGLAVAIILAMFFFNWLGKRLKKKQGDTEEKRVSVTWKILIIVVLVFFFVFYGSVGAMVFRGQGYEYAKNLEEFPVFDPSSSLGMQSPEVAVLRMYGEYVYAVPFTRGTKEFEKKLVIVKMSDIKTPLSLEKVGPLRALGTTPSQP